jgi:hypothetical protein
MPAVQPIGAAVIITGLGKEEYNGLQAEIIGQLQDGRYPVRLFTTHHQFRIKPVNVVRSIPLLNQLLEEELAFLELCRLLPAATSCRLSFTSKAMHEKLADPLTAAWCANSRRALLEERNVAGDLPLGQVGDLSLWTLERVYLCEHPPRFPRIRFRMMSDMPTDSGARKIARVARLLERHPRLRIRVNGYANSRMPTEVGHMLAQARACSVRDKLLHLLRDHPE